MTTETENIQISTFQIDTRWLEAALESLGLTVFGSAVVVCPEPIGGRRKCVQRSIARPRHRGISIHRNRARHFPPCGRGRRRGINHPSQRQYRRK